MSKTTKIVLGIVAVLVVIAGGVGFLLARVLGDSFTLSADKASTIGQEIVTHDLPDGFEPFFGMDILGLRAMMAATSFEAGGDIASDGAVLFLMSLPSGTSESELRSQAGGEFSSQSGQNIDFRYEGTRTALINGAEVEIEIYIGASDDGSEVRQELGVFRANDDSPAMVMMMAPESTFDASGFHEFLDSTN